MKWDMLCWDEWWDANPCRAKRLDGKAESSRVQYSTRYSSDPFYNQHISLLMYLDKDYIYEQDYSGHVALELAPGQRDSRGDGSTYRSKLRRRQIGVQARSEIAHISARIGACSDSLGCGCFRRRCRSLLRLPSTGRIEYIYRSELR